MRPRYTSSLEHLSVKYGSYWQSVLRFGLPFAILYCTVNYIIFRVTMGNVEVRYPWRSVAIPDIAYMFLVSTIWWAFMRQIAAWKKRSEK